MIIYNALIMHMKDDNSPELTEEFDSKLLLEEDDEEEIDSPEEIEDEEEEEEESFGFSMKKYENGDYDDYYTEQIALAHYLDVDPEEIEEDDPDYRIDRKEYRVLDDDTADDYARESFEENIRNNLSNYYEALEGYVEIDPDWWNEDMWESCGNDWHDRDNEEKLDFLLDHDLIWFNGFTFNPSDSEKELVPDCFSSLKMSELSFDDEDNSEEISMDITFDENFIRENWDNIDWDDPELEDFLEEYDDDAINELCDYYDNSYDWACQMWGEEDVIETYMDSIDLDEVISDYMADCYIDRGSELAWYDGEEIDLGEWTDGDDRRYNYYAYRRD